MFGHRRRFPLLVPLLAAVAFGYLLAGGAGSLIGAALVIPFLVLKLLFLLLLVRLVLGFLGGGRRNSHGYGRGRAAWCDQSGGYERRGQAPAGDEAESDDEPAEDPEWLEAVKAARREIEKLFPDPKQ